MPTASEGLLSFEQRGSTWTTQYTRKEEWPFTLVARHVYYGKDRLLTTLTLARTVGETTRTIFTSHVDLLIGRQRTEFAKEVAKRLFESSKVPAETIATAVNVMLDAMLERLTSTRDEVDIVSAQDIVLPKDLTPPYALWPMVPISRPGMLVGPSGQGKSTLAQLAALSVVLDTQLLSRLEPRKAGPVVYIGQEEDAIQWAARLEMICRGHKLTRPKHLYYMKLRGGSLIDSGDLIAETIATKRAVLVIVDSAQATWGAGSDDAIREYASRWYATVESLGCAAFVLEHPDRAQTAAAVTGREMLAAGTSVKRDRVGHAWSMKSTEIPAENGQPFRHHVRLHDEKRNYVPRQSDIHYEIVISGFSWARFEESEEMTAASIVGASKVWGQIVTLMQDPDAGHEEFGWTLDDLKDKLGAKDDRRIRQECVADLWRPSETTKGVEEKIARVEGTGTSRSNPARYVLITQTSSSPLDHQSGLGDSGGLH